MRISINVTNYSWPGGPQTIAEQLDQVVGAADAAGVDTVWVSDHLLQADPTAKLQEAMLEAYTTLGYLAARSTRVRLGTMVSAVTYRAAALLVKAVTSLDVLSGGRARLGIGAGYQEMEAAAMGLDLPPVGERFAYLEDTLLLADRMWRGDASAFHGKRLHLDHPVASPLPLRRPAVLVGGAGEQRTLRLVAQYADACNLFDIPDGGATIRHKLRVLAQHCEDVQRPYEQIEKTVSTRLEAGEDAGALAERCERLAGLGIDHAVLITAGPWTVPALGTVAAALPLVREIRPAREASAGRGGR